MPSSQQLLRCDLTYVEDLSKNASCRGRVGMIAGGEHIDGASSVGGLLAVPIGGRGAQNVHDQHAKGSVYVLDKPRLVAVVNSKITLNNTFCPCYGSSLLPKARRGKAWTFDGWKGSGGLSEWEFGAPCGFVGRVDV